MSFLWTIDEDRVLRGLYRNIKTRDISKKLVSRTENAVRSRAYRIGITRKRLFR